MRLGGTERERQRKPQPACLPEKQAGPIAWTGSQWRRMPLPPQLPPPQVLMLLLFLLVHSNGCSASVCEELACFADYLQTLTCTWGEGLRPSRATAYNLTAKWNCGEGGTCHLLAVSGNDTLTTQFTCLAEQRLCFGENGFNVTAILAADEPVPRVPKGCRKTFLFNKNIKPQPPFNLSVVASPWSYNISWKTPYKHRKYHPLNGRLQYELRYRKRGHPWQGQSQKHLLQDVTALWLLPKELEWDAEYEVQVRARPGPSYQGTWSRWSSPATLTTLPKISANSQGDQGGNAKWLVLLSLCPALLAFLGKRLWKKLDFFVPSPAPFFQPLYLGHQGDFKKWVGIPGTGATLEVFERGPGFGPEAFGTGSFKLLPPSSGEAECGGTAKEAPPRAPEGHEEATQEQPYGRLSIDTVTVAGGPAPCCQHCDHCVAKQPQQEVGEEAAVEWTAVGVRDPYRRIHCEGGGWDGQFPETALWAEGVPKNTLIPPTSSPSWLSTPLLAAAASVPPSQKAGDSLGREARKEGLLFFGPPVPLPPPPKPCSLIAGGGLSASEEETPFYSTLLSLCLEADNEGDPENSLDLDTIDSGFADCDYGSPLDSECERRPAGGEGEETQAFLPSYVKQWVSGHGFKA